MTPDLGARRARAVNRAMTRYVAHPSTEVLALIGWLNDAPAEAFMYDLAEVHAEIDAHGFTDHTVDGVPVTTRPAVVDLLMDRYGVTRDEAEQLMAAADPAGRSGPRHLGSV